MKENRNDKIPVHKRTKAQSEVIPTLDQKVRPQTVLLLEQESRQQHLEHCHYRQCGLRQSLLTEFREELPMRLTVPKDERPVKVSIDSFLLLGL